LPRSKLVQSVVRATEILEQVASSEDGLTLQQLSDRVGLKSTTCHNLARTLMARGFLEQATRPTRYRLGGKVISLVDQYRNRPLHQRAAQVMSELFEEHSSARLVWAEPVGTDILLTLRIGPERPGVLEHPQHSVMPSYSSAAGIVFQAFWPHESRYSHRQRYPFSEYGVHTWHEEQKLETFLDQVRLQGYAMPPVGQSGLHRLAVPVFSATRELVAALGMALPVGKVSDFDADRDRLVSQLQAAAGRIVTGSSSL
jgi:DNA-binding IclR family transcriptional regulator